MSYCACAVYTHPLVWPLTVARAMSILRTVNVKTEPFETDSTTKNVYYESIKKEVLTDKEMQLENQEMPDNNDLVAEKSFRAVKRQCPPDVETPSSKHPMLTSQPSPPPTIYYLSQSPLPQTPTIPPQISTVSLSQPQTQTMSSSQLPHTSLSPPPQTTSLSLPMLPKRKSFYGFVSTPTGKPNKFCLKDILPERLNQNFLDKRDDRTKIILNSLQMHLNQWEYETHLAAIDLTLPEKYSEKLENDQYLVHEILERVARRLHYVEKADEVLLPLLDPNEIQQRKVLLPNQLKRVGTLKLPLKHDMSISMTIIDFMTLFEWHHPEEYRFGDEKILPPEKLKPKIDKLLKETRPAGDNPVVYCGTKKIFGPTKKSLKESSENSVRPVVKLVGRPKKQVETPATQQVYTSDAQSQGLLSQPMSYWDLDYIHNECGYQGEGTVIAVVDSGINEHHITFRENTEDPQIIGLANFCSSDTCKDASGHGTMCAAVACGQPYEARSESSNKVIPIPGGVAPKAKLIICKVAEGEKGEGKHEHVVQALGWLKENYTEDSSITVDVVSLSLGSQGFTKDIVDAITELTCAGVIVVCAASNKGHKRRQSICFPARLGNVMCVGSHDNHGKPSLFSPVGQDIDFLAHGENIPAPITGSYGEAKLYSGTSCSTSAVAGLVCLVLECIGKAYPSTVNGVNILAAIHNHWMMKEILRELCTNPGMHCEDRGYGALNPERFFSNPKAIVQLVLHELQPQMHATKKAKTKTKPKLA